MWNAERKMTVIRVFYWTCTVCCLSQNVQVALVIVSLGRHCEIRSQMRRLVGEGMRLGKAKINRAKQTWRGVSSVAPGAHVYSKTTHTLARMAGGQARGGVREKENNSIKDALNEACPVPTIKQKHSVNPASCSLCKSTSTRAASDSGPFFCSLV